jgi:hypothetical protein
VKADEYRYNKGDLGREEERVTFTLLYLL